MNYRSKRTPSSYLNKKSLYTRDEGCAKRDRFNFISGGDKNIRDLQASYQIHFEIKIQRYVQGVNEYQRQTYKYCRGIELYLAQNIHLFT